MTVTSDPSMTRRGVCAMGLAAAAGLAGAGLIGAGLSACKRRESGGGGHGGGAGGSKELVVYCSADSVYAEPIFAAFTKKTGIAVKAVFDTEATKTTGLVNRLLTEHAGKARADVWWSSEPFGTIRLARAGALAPYTSAAAEEAMKPYGGWPRHLRGKEELWYGFGSRARVFVYNTKLLKAEGAPRTLAGLADAKFKGRVGIARPQFGTTRGHMAAVYAAAGESGLRGWLETLKANQVRLLDGNASVVRAVGTGEIHVGWTDTDDVIAGKREGWPVEMAFEKRGETPGISRGFGTLLLPNTAALVRGGPNAAHAGTLIDYLLSPEAQRTLAKSDSANIPVDPALAKELITWAPAPDQVWPVDFDQVADAVEGAMKACDEVLG